MINIKDLDKAQLLVELYNHSHQQGFGILQPSRSLTVEDARKLLEQTTYFDYLYGKVMKVDLSSDEEFEERLYDRDNGQGMAQSVVDGMRKRKELEKAVTEVVEQGVRESILDNNYIDEQPINNYNEPKPINNLNERIDINNIVEKKTYNTIDDFDPNINLNNKPMPKTVDLPFDVTGTFIGYYEARELDDIGREHKSIKLGLFKKGQVYDVDRNRPVQSYVDLLSGNTAGLLLYENGKDITTSPEFISPELVPYKPLSTDYGVDYYSSLMQEIEAKYGVSAFTSKFVGDGLIPWEEYWEVSDLHEEYKGVTTSIPLFKVLESLVRFNNIRQQYNKKIADPKVQASVVKSIKDAPKYVVNNLPYLSHLPEDFNTIKHF